MKPSHKINAYTISELLVALLISMLVMACMLQLYVYINGQVMKQLKETEQNREVIRTITFLHQQFQSAEYITYDDNKLVFGKEENNTFFQAGNKPLIKQKALTDTLNYAVAITDTACINNNIYKANLHFNNKQYLYNINFHKSYPRDYLINHTQRHEYFVKPVASK